jgi:serine-type D-Ala-D-Ala carboxypeptidase (penicillin-binding protein 5/6)
VRLQPFPPTALVVLTLVPLLLIVGLVLGSSWLDAGTGTGGTTTIPLGRSATTTTLVEVDQQLDPTTKPGAPSGPAQAEPGLGEQPTDGQDGQDATSPPAVDASAYVVVDADGEVLAEQAANEPRSIGSITKLMTARVVMEAGDLSDTAGVPELDPNSDESRIGLEPGTLYQRDVLLRAMLIVSASDAAHALATDIAGSEEAFVDMMNAEAAELGLDGSHFATPVGLDQPEHYSTARDVATLATLLMQDESFRAIVSRRDATLHGRTLPATNDLLASYPGADGVKTGHTDEAGWCIAASATRDGRRVLVVVLGSSTRESRNAAATALLDWAFTH